MTNREALNVIADMCNVLQLLPNTRQGEAMMMAINSLKNGTPPAENKGEWIKIKSGDKDFPESIVCSKCKNENSHLDFNEHGEPIGKVFVTSKFCPNCGVRMRGEQDDI